MHRDTDGVERSLLTALVAGPWVPARDELSSPTPQATHRLRLRAQRGFLSEQLAQVFRGDSRRRRYNAQYELL